MFLGDAITLDYRIRTYGEDWQSVHQRVPIRWTPCRLGGERPWFVCDVSANGIYCGRRVAKLYGAGRLFACRHCYRLGYAVQHGGLMDRAHHRLRRLLRKLGADYDGQVGGPPANPIRPWHNSKPSLAAYPAPPDIAVQIFKTEVDAVANLFTRCVANQDWRRTPGRGFHGRSVETFGAIGQDGEPPEDTT